MHHMSHPTTSTLANARMPFPGCNRSLSQTLTTFKYLPNSIHLQSPQLNLSEYEIIFDVRSFKQYSKTRLQNSVNLCIPTTLLKRKSLDLIEILNNFINIPKHTKDLILHRLNQEPGNKIKVLIYDSRSKFDQVSYALYQTCLRFESYSNKFDVFILNGGIQAVSQELLDESGLGINTNNRLNGLILPSPIKSSFHFKKDINLSSRYHKYNLVLARPAKYPNWLKFVTRQDSLFQHFIDLFIKIEAFETTRLNKLTHTQNSKDPISPPCCSPCREISFKLPRGIEYTYKNRYNNIFPYEHSRVKLHNHSDDYFNGNYIDVNPIVKNQFKYIATQNPLDSTIDDFWTTISQQNVELIINLENKPANYFNHDTVTSCETIETTSSYTITKLNSKIFHLHYLNWPDFGIPDFSTLLELINIKNNLYIKYGLSNKVLVHCSAGCGRTGVFITIDSLIQACISNKKDILLEESDLIFRLIMHERRQRISMVQNLDQFIACYQLFLYYLSQDI